MNRTVRAGIAALAFAGLVAQPVVANAGIVCHVPPTHGTAGPLPMLFVAGFFLCAGVSIGKVDEDARRAGVEVEKGAHGRALLGCLLPFHKHVDAVSAKG
jgi:hypothetical protein